MQLKIDLVECKQDKYQSVCLLEWNLFWVSLIMKKTSFAFRRFVVNCQIWLFVIQEMACWQFREEHLQEQLHLQEHLHLQKVHHRGLLEAWSIWIFISFPTDSARVNVLMYRCRRWLSMNFFIEQRYSVCGTWFTAENKWTWKVTPVLKTDRILSLPTAVWVLNEDNGSSQVCDETERWISYSAWIKI